MTWADTPEGIVEQAVEQQGPYLRRVCLFSGGSDSSVLAHRCRDEYNELAFVDTGTALPGVREFVVEFAAWLGKPLVIKEAGDAFRRMVLGGTIVRRGERKGLPEEGHGFPGPGGHAKAYARLKERQIEALLREYKVGQHHHSRVLFLTGVRQAESKRRTNRDPVTRRYSAVFANPLWNWTNADMTAYKREHALPQSDVAALIHRSGECNCGAFASAGEREMLADLWPAWFEENIASLEREAAAAGIKRCRWGVAGDKEKATEGGPMCSSCDFRQEQAA